MGVRGDRVESHYASAAVARGNAALYEEASALGELYRVREERILDLLASQSGSELLDAGCGPGRMISFLSERRPGHFAITGLDFSEPMIAQAQQVVGPETDVRLVVGRVEEMPFSEGSFSTVLAMGLLEYVDVRAAIAEIARVTRAGGLVVTTMQNPLSPYRIWDAAVYRHVVRLRGGRSSPIRQRLRERALRQALVEADLLPTEVIYYDFNVFLSPLDRWLPSMEIRISRALDRATRGALRRLGTGFIVAARRRPVRRRLVPVNRGHLASSVTR
jgi:ubiquinone/menaquinone biosynthesis C-methylase UbiE